MKRIEEQTKQSIRAIRLLIAVIIIAYSSSVIENLYLVIRGYTTDIVLFKLVTMVVTLPAILIIGFQYRKIVHNERNLRTILAHLQDGVIAANQNEEIEFVNDVVEKLFIRRGGYTNLRDIFNASVYTNMDGSTISLEDRPLAKAIRGESVYNQPVCVSFEEKDVYLLVNATPIRDSRGDIRGVVETFRDITDFKTFERASINRNRAFYSLAENISDLIAMLDLNANVVYASPSHRTLLGIDHNEYVGQAGLERVHPEDMADLRKEFDRILSRKEGVQTEFRYLHADGHYVLVDAKVEPVLDQNNKVASVVIVARDVTARKRAEELLRGQNKALTIIARGTPLEEVLTELTELVESHRPGGKCGIFVTKADYKLNIGPSLPNEYLDYLEPYLQAERVPRYMFENVVYTDIVNDPIWNANRELREIAARNHLVSMWSKPIRGPSGEPIGIFGVYYDVAINPIHEDIELYEVYADLAALAIDQRISAQEMAFMAHHDALTGLPNRRVVEATLEQISLTGNLNTLYAVMMLDLDQFKSFNDTFGYRIGDRVIQVLGERLSASVRSQDEVCRNGGDEFTILLKGIDSKMHALQIADDILQVVREPIYLDDHELQISTSMGIAYCPEHGHDSSELFKNAHTAMNDAKSRGRNEFSVYRPEMNARAYDRLLLERDIRKAVENKEFALHYQPKFGIETNCITGAEALIRWIHPIRGSVFPGEFIPIAEDTGSIIAIGHWVLETVVQQIKAWELMGLMIPIAVNVSAQQLIRPSFPDIVHEILSRYGVDSKWLELEITETSLLADEEVVSKNIRELTELGVSVMLDDFGTGYSSLSYLTRFKINSIKIDHSFVDGLVRQDEAHESIVTAIISLAHNLGMKVIAEGVETVGQLQFLKDRICDEAQGYFFSRPIPVNEFEAFCLGQRV